MKYKNIELGYACINQNLGGFKSYTLKNLKENVELVKNKIRYNWILTWAIIENNIENQINFYRISSNIVPLATHPSFEKFLKDNNWNWKTDKHIIEAMENIKMLQQKHNLRISIHPGQYTVMNTPNEKSKEKMKKDLEYHMYILNKTNGSDLIIHVGGVYGDKDSSKKRWIKVYNTLNQETKEKNKIRK